MSMGKRISVTDNNIIEAARNSLSGASAAVKLGIKYDTFKVHAKRLGVFNPNPSGKGIKKPINDERKYHLDDILNGKHPQYPTGKLKKRLLDEGIFSNVCSECGIKEWNNKKLVMHLDHKDGNRHNHSLDNVRMLCPNCHSQTDTYCGKNKAK
jgi:hypothetical protein